MLIIRQTFLCALGLSRIIKKWGHCNFFQLVIYYVKEGIWFKYIIQVAHKKSLATPACLTKVHEHGHQMDYCERHADHQATSA